MNPAVRFGVIGLNHGHIYAQVDALLAAGAELVACFAIEPDLIEPFARRYPSARLARSAEEILEDPSVRLIASAAINCDRAPLGISAMRHGKDFMVDKPGFTSLEQLSEARAVRAETGRIYSVDFCERFHHRATVKAGELVQQGAIGRVVHTIGMGPHRSNPGSRPGWFFERECYGGILADIASHQVDQFLFFTGCRAAQVRAARVANCRHREYPQLQDFGEMLIEGEGVSGYIRVDWLTPGGLDTWGDGRLFLLGTAGTIEIRKNCDVCGRPGGDHLLLVDNQSSRYIDASGQDCPYAAQLLHDVLDRTETAMPQEHCFLASELALQAQTLAELSGQ